MKNGARYVVETHWGVFSLDEGAYQDYLAGKLWITWKPGGAKPAEPVCREEQRPVHVTDRAMALRDEADRDGILSTLHRLGAGEAAAPCSSRLAEVSIDELNLTVRAANGLKRAAAGTFGKLRALMAKEGGILSVRNLGQKSAEEITRVFFEESYARLLPYEKARYWQEVLDGREKDAEKDDR